jgi:hypothetical protein
MRSHRSRRSKLRGNRRRRFRLRVPGFARYRANFLNQKNGIAAVFRLIPSKVLTAEELGLPPVLKRFAMLKKGLVLVTGPTGSGKSTTLAAMVDYANLHRKDHIITVEDPIEFVHKSQQSLVNHREVGMHTKSFASALRGALREIQISFSSVKCAISRRLISRSPPPHGSPRLRHAAHAERAEDDRPRHRRFPRWAAKPDPRQLVGIAQRCRRAEPL